MECGGLEGRGMVVVIPGGFGVLAEMGERRFVTEPVGWSLGLVFIEMLLKTPWCWGLLPCWILAIEVGWAVVKTVDDAKVQAGKALEVDVPSTGGERDSSLTQADM